MCFGKISSQNFKAAEGKITWVNVYESALSQEEIRSQIAKDAQLSPVAATFTGRTEGVVMSCQGSIPIYMEGPLSYFVILDFKPGRYRVTVTDLQLKPANTISLYGVESSDPPVALEKYQLRNRDGEFRTGALATKSLACMDEYLLRKFEFKEVTESAEAW